MKDCGAGEPRLEDAGRVVKMAGWVKTVRDMGGILFFELRDHSGVIQVVDETGAATRLHNEDVVAVEGTLRARPEGTVNPDLETGEVEVGAVAIRVLARSEPPPFPIDDRVEANEELRLKYRYLDLRRPRLARNLKIRSEVNHALRVFMRDQGFLEVETPSLTASTPEGARDYLVPARIRPGSFYALPQSPQQFKQMLMVAGVERYYQIARCWRDEDLRSHRQPEFSQLDLEMSFVDEDDVMAVVEGSVSAAVEAATGKPLALPLPRMTYAEAMDRYGTDKPDLRFGSPIIDVTAAFAGTGFKAFAGAPAVRGLRVPGGGAGASRSSLENLVSKAVGYGAKGMVWAAVEAGPTPAPAFEWRSPVAKFVAPAEQSAVNEALGAEVGDLLLLVADQPRPASKILGQMRLDLLAPPASQPPEGPWETLWVTDFPAFQLGEASQAIEPESHPFTGLREDELHLLETDPLAMTGRHYDLVMNGMELGSGSIRITDPELQERVFAVLGIGHHEAVGRFGHLLTAFQYGVPPHGGFAFGTDRLCMQLSGEVSMREVMAFPKMAGHDPLTGAPTPVEDAQLRELGLRVIAPPKPS